jgi:hypothetical protein
VVKAYLDTCIVSGLAKNDLSADDSAALLRILQAHKLGTLELVASDLVRGEISKIPENYRPPHSVIYNLLKDVPLVPSHQRTPPFRPTDFPFGVRPDPLLMRLVEILPDADDAAHIYQAAKNDVRYVITADKRTMVRHSVAVTNLSGVTILTPVEFERVVLLLG